MFGHGYEDISRLSGGRKTPYTWSASPRGLCSRISQRGKTELSTNFPPLAPGLICVWPAAAGSCYLPSPPLQTAALSSGPQETIPEFAFLSYLALAIGHVNSTVGVRDGQNGSRCSHHRCLATWPETRAGTGVQEDSFNPDSRAIVGLRFQILLSVCPLA